MKVTKKTEEKVMKKFLSILLALIMVVSCVSVLASCGKDKEQGDGKDTDTKQTETGKDTEAPETKVDMRVAMITDYGDITDESFNQATYTGASEWCTANGVDFKYYKPTGETTADRIAMVDSAIDEGYNVIVMPGYAFAETIVECTEANPDIKFVALDVAKGDILSAALGDEYDWNPDNWKVEDYYYEDNVFCAVYQEELAGYMAGYAAVKEGYKHLGFLGGQAVPAVVRYGYGYVQGINDAAKELGIANDVKVEYVYGNQFYGDADITAYMDTWYTTKGVEVVFACGGGIYSSAAEAAAKVGGKVIGVDNDQHVVIDGYGAGMTVTSAMKGLAATVKTVLGDIRNGKWADYAGKIETLGLVSGDDPTLNYVQLPIASWTMTNFTVDDYKDLVKKMYEGTITVSADTSVEPTTEVAVEYAGKIKG